MASPSARGTFASKETAAGGANGGKDGEHGHMGNMIGGMVSDVDG